MYLGIHNSVNLDSVVLFKILKINVPFSLILLKSLIYIYREIKDGSLNSNFGNCGLRLEKYIGTYTLSEISSSGRGTLYKNPLIKLYVLSLT